MPDCSARRAEFYSAELALVVGVLDLLCTAELVPRGTLPIGALSGDKTQTVPRGTSPAVFTDLPEAGHGQPSSFDSATAESKLDGWPCPASGRSVKTWP